MIQKIKNDPFARNSLILFASGMIGNVLGYVLHLLMGRMVSVQVYGEIESLFSLLAIVSVPATTLALTATRFSAGSLAKNDPLEAKKIFDYLKKKVLLFGAPLFFLSLAFIPLGQKVLKIENGWAFFWLITSVWVSFLVSVSSGILIGWQKFKESGLAGILGTFSKLFWVVFFLFLGFGSEGATAGLVLSGVCLYLVYEFFLSKTFKKKNDFEKADSKTVHYDFSSLKRYFIPAFFATLTITIIGNADMLVAKNKLDGLESGYYGALTIMSKAIFFATSAIASVLFSMSSEENFKKEKKPKSFKKALAITAFICFFSFLIYVLFPEIVVKFFFGEKYLSVAGYLGYFAFLVSLFSFNNLLINHFLAVKKIKSVYLVFVLSLAMVGHLVVGKADIFAIIKTMLIYQIIFFVVLSLSLSENFLEKFKITKQVK